MKTLKKYLTPKSFNLLILLFSIALPLAACAKTSDKNLQPTNNQLVQIDAPQTVYAGEPFLIKLTTQSSVQNVKVTWNNRSLNPIFKDENGQKTAEVLLSVPLKTKETQRNLTLTADNNSKKLTYHASFAVEHKEYPEQRLTVSKKFVSPNKAEQERIKKEAKIIKAALNKVSTERYWDLPLSRPIPYIKTEEETIGRVSSVYGLRRFFNNQEKDPHKGVDLSAPKNEKILACMDGKVVLVGDFFYSGRCVFVDHGQGILTYYLHMTEPLVKEGQIVKRGETLGLVGSTGRSTGPHLHLGFTVLGETVNPAPFMPDL
ncbi:M23 family metallopeptidase [Desulfovibrio litoralis]|uniref:Murein DD-endopeptidase MepM and murein hydrolase activator NlpD, contain LysM domain n=1 Tax=Desulfovibrio litoralis DSM 11393 TaxID=1121455 RepID=A0A1M7S6P8_9BACT|nr:M23 family metallopeptidase [Desulfovibrio litoralis]SHN54054.1 Murein DD-endopeptidase MepM and murein hydrolase activator NlpD, contain LysM domain [Desulfovibrio litoralis DSM 11393]